MPPPTSYRMDSGAATGPPKTTVENANDAMARVSSQDTSLIYGSFMRSEISQDVYNLMISQLANTCGAPGHAFAQLTQKGVDLMKSYSNLSFEQQISWIRADLRVREAIYVQDDREIRSRHAQSGRSYNASLHAIAQRM